MTPTDTPPEPDPAPDEADTPDEDVSPPDADALADAGLDSEKVGEATGVPREGIDVALGETAEISSEE